MPMDAFFCDIQGIPNNRPCLLLMVFVYIYSGKVLS